MSQALLSINALDNLISLPRSGWNEWRVLHKGGKLIVNTKVSSFFHLNVVRCFENIIQSTKNAKLCTQNNIKMSKNDVVRC